MEQDQLLISSERSETTKAIKKAIFDFQGAGLVVTKGAENIHYKSKYADLADVMRTIQPTLTETGLLIMHFTKGDGYLETEITHVESEEFFMNTYSLNAISKTPQAIGSALTYAKRYAIIAMLNITVDGDDDDGNAGSGSKPKEENAPAADESNTDTREWINPNTSKWFDAKIFILANGGKLDKAVKKYRISSENAANIVKKEGLKPGGKMWPFAIAYLAKDGNKAEAITKAFDISEQDLQDLQVDALNSINPNTDPTNTKK